MSRAFAAVGDRDGSLPPTLTGLADRLDVLQLDRQLTMRSRRRGLSRFLWQKALSAGARKAAVAAWEQAASRADKHRVQASAGLWVHEGAELTPGVASRRTFAIAMRMRFGLNIGPALGGPAEANCGHVKAGGERCACSLDQFGHHAVACGRGGGFVARHDAIVRELARSLKAMGLRVRVEVWVDDLTEQLPSGRTREARMDLVVESSHGTDYLDVTCFHPFSSEGHRRTHASGGTPLAQEERKRDRYPVREPASRRRITMARFVPVAVTTYGLVGPAAVALFAEYEAERRERAGGVAGRNGGRLAALVSEVAVFGAARMILQGFSAPDGQEWAHRCGRVAFVPAAP